MERPAQTAARQGAAAAAAQAPRQLPPGFRFHPTDEELVVRYLRQKALSRPLPAAVIPVVDDVASLDPWDLPGASEGEGYFFSRLRRAPATGRGGGCRRRAAGSGYWKATGKARPVFLEQQGPGCGGGGKRHLVGVKTALAYHYHGEPPPSSSSRTGWVMHVYRLAVSGGGVAEQSKNASHPGEWVVCRIFLKNRPRRRSRDNTVDSQAAAPPPLQHQADYAGQLRPLPSPSPSSSSCVTDTSDQEEVSSIGGGRAASQRGA